MHSQCITPPSIVLQVLVFDHKLPLVLKTGNISRIRKLTKGCRIKSVVEFSSERIASNNNIFRYLAEENICLRVSVHDCHANICSRFVEEEWSSFFTQMLCYCRIGGRTITFVSAALDSWPCLVTVFHPVCAFVWCTYSRNVVVFWSVHTQPALSLSASAAVTFCFLDTGLVVFIYLSS